MLYLPRHNGALHACPLERFDQLGKLTQRKPVNRNCAAILNFRKSLLLDRDHDHFVSLRARGIEYEEGKLAVARDKPDAHKRWSVSSGQWAVVSAGFYLPLITDY